MIYMILLSAISSVLLVCLCAYVVVLIYRYGKKMNDYTDDLAARYDRLLTRFIKGGKLTIEALKILNKTKDCNQSETIRKECNRIFDEFVELEKPYVKSSIEGKK